MTFHLSVVDEDVEETIKFTPAFVMATSIDSLNSRKKASHIPSLAYEHKVRTILQHSLSVVVRQLTIKFTPAFVPGDQY